MPSHGNPIIKSSVSSPSTKTLTWATLAMPSTQKRPLNIAAGRATFAGRAPRVYAYVHRQEPWVAAGLDQFLARSGVRPHESVTMISGNVGEFAKTAPDSQIEPLAWSAREEQ